MLEDKTALVMTYHVKNSKRTGGFHYFIRFLNEEGYNIDWVTIPVSITWLLGKNDRECATNFISVFIGKTYKENDREIRCFTIPLWIPAKLAKKMGLKLADEYWPKWEKIKRKLKRHYDVTIIEGVACQYASDIKRAFDDTVLIYRPSDVLATFSSVKTPEKMEINAIKYSDITACVDETEIEYYKRIGADKNKLTILRNPLASEDDYNFLQNYKPIVSSGRKKAVYMGVSFCDFELIEYAARENRHCDFYVVGPFEQKSHDNVIYTGPMKRKEYELLFEQADVAIAPTLNTEYKLQNGIKYGFTGKIIAYMKYLLPIVATCSCNYLNIDGFYCVDQKDEFSNKITECINYTIDDREKLREGYLYVMKVFSEKESKGVFLHLLQDEKEGDSSLTDKQ